MTDTPLLQAAPISELKERLRVLLRDEAYKEGDFTLVSGRKSKYYVNSKIVTLSSEGAYLVGEVLLDCCIRANVAALGGLTLGADPIVSAVAVIGHLRGRPVKPFIVRKEAKGHGTGSRIEGFGLEGTDVAIVDDVGTTGGSALKAVQAAVEIGCRIQKVFCLVDREEGAAETIREAGYDFESVFTLTELRRR